MSHIEELSSGNTTGSGEIGEIHRQWLKTGDISDERVWVV
jgi:hypothetical protein